MRRVVIVLGLVGLVAALGGAAAEALARPTFAEPSAVVAQQAMARLADALIVVAGTAAAVVAGRRRQWAWLAGLGIALLASVLAPVVVFSLLPYVPAVRPDALRLNMLNGAAAALGPAVALVYGLIGFGRMAGRVVHEPAIAASPSRA